MYPKGVVLLQKYISLPEDRLIYCVKTSVFLIEKKLERRLNAGDKKSPCSVNLT